MLRARPTPASLVLACASLLCGTGCTIRDRYLIDRTALVSLAALPEAEREGRKVPAVREQDGKRTLLRGDRIPLAPSAWVTDPVSVGTRVPAPMITAGAVLTVIGSILSIAGTSAWLATRNSGHDDVSNGMLGVSIAAEPIMLSGTLLWVFGTLAHPTEVAEESR